MAPPANNEEPKFRFIVKIMPPRRPANSLLKRSQRAKVEEPLHIIAVPARASETFADVWKHIKERYERNYTAEEVAQGWFHKLQDRHGADIDSHDGVGELGYTKNTPSEDLVLIMLQNGIDRDSSVPDTSGLRPPGFSRPELTAEQQQEAKRRKTQEERYGVVLEDTDEDTPIQSRERSLAPGSPGPGAQVDGDDDDTHKVDADGFAVPMLPGSASRKRKRPHTTRGDIVPSSMEGENDEDILVQDSQTARNNAQSVAETQPTEHHASRARVLRSVPADAGAAASTSSARAARAQTHAPGALTEDDQGPLRSQRLAALQATSSKQTAKADNTRPPPRSPPTPVSATSQPFTQQPPESAQRPKPTPPVAFAPVFQRGQPQPTSNREVPEDGVEFDPIEDDDLLQGITGTANDDHDGTELTSTLPMQAPVSSAPVSTKSKAKSGKLPRPKTLLSSTPKASAALSKKSASTPVKNALERLSGTQGSSGKNARSQSGTLDFWTPEEDSLLLQGIRCGLKATEITKKYGFEGRTPSAVRYRRILLIKQNPGIENATRESTSEGGTPGASATKRRRWSIGEKQIISRAIADGYDALEIHAKYFPGRSEDSVIRIVLSLQDQAWKVASKDSMFPKNSANLPGWTPKDSCKLKRTFIEGLTTDVAKKTYFSRWTMQEVQKQLDAYSAHFKAMQEDQARASRAGSAIRKATFGSSQMPADSSQLLVNSSPVERSMQVRAARRPSVNAQQQNQATHVPSSPPQPSTTKSMSQQVQVEHQPSNKEQRSSSPTVDITITEQDTARDEVFLIEQDALHKSIRRPSSGKGRQSTLNFSRDKGKQRAVDPRPTSEELDAQYVRHPTSSRTMRSATQPQNSQNATVAQPHTSIEDEDEASDDQHTPADDLEMLDAGLDHGGSVLGNPKGSIDNAGDVIETNPVTEHGWQDEDAMVGGVASQAPDALGGRRQSASTAMTMESPMTASSVSSAQRRRSRVESGVDTRVAKQLSQELNRSLSREAREEAAHEDQVFSTPDPKINRYHRTPRRSNVTLPEDTEPRVDQTATEEGHTFRTQAFQTQDSTTARSQRKSRVSFQTDQSPRSTDAGSNSARSAPSLQPSPQIGASNSGDTNAITPATTPAKPGKLPSRGSSYASRIKDIHRPSQVATKSSAKVTKLTSNDTTEIMRDNVSPPPTDADIWERSAVAESIGRNRQEYFEDLKLSTFSIRAMGSGDWEEVRRLKAEERRLHRQRKIARGDYVPSKRDAQHPDGPAQGGDAEQADEEVIRVDDVSDASSEVGEDYDEKIWSDADFEQPADVDHDRHFSEVEDDDDEDGQVDAGATKEIEEPQDSHRSRHVSVVNEDEPMLDPNEHVQEAAQANAVEVAGEHEEPVDELDLPTVHTLPETNSTARSGPADDNLQELDNSDAGGSPTRIARRKRKIHDEENSPKERSDKHQPDDRAVMPPPPSTNSISHKRARRRKRHSSGQHASKSGSERSSSFSHPHPSSDAPQQHVPSTLDRSEPAAHKAKRARLGEATAAEQTPNASRAQKSQTANASQKAPSSSMKGSQRSNGGGMSGLSGLVRKAHIPTPPKVKQTPLKEEKKLDIRADDDESDESSDSD